MGNEKPWINQGGQQNLPGYPPAMWLAGSFTPFTNDCPSHKPPFVYIYMYILIIYIHSWLVVSTPLKNMKVSWDDYSQYMENKIHVPNHQPVYAYIYT